MTCASSRVKTPPTMNLRHALPLAVFAPLLSSCAHEAPRPTTATAAASAPAAAKFDALTREEFNRFAAEAALPLFWSSDKNHNGALDPDELATYWGLDKGASLADYVVRNQAGGASFTPRAQSAYALVVAQKTGGVEKDPRRAAVKKELAQGRVTLVATDLSSYPAEDRAFVASILRASTLLETLYAKQQGTLSLAGKLPTGDSASKTLFFRGQGPTCEAPLTQGDAHCGALLPADMPKSKISGLYPLDLLASNPTFCEDLQTKHADKSLLDPFTVVVREGGKLVSKPFHEVWPEDVRGISSELETAARALGDREPALFVYLKAAAKAFLDDQWWPADEAWAAMDAQNSKYYLRIAPDEVYDEPCSTKALYHVSFGLINQGSVTWQKKLDPLKAQMENALAGLAGKPYAARDVSFKLPDFVDIALNAGDSRKAFGATIGQSLPNFGPVANGGRGRTVAMTNFYTDPDSIATAKEQAESLFCSDVMAKWTSAQEPQLMSTVLHEAAHNLGPAHQYKAEGKIDREAFGGPLASTLEELKAQTAALYFTEWLTERKELTRDAADQAHVRDVFWAFGHISRGMYGDGDHPKNYSQLSAIQLGWMLRDGAATWQPDTAAANGRDKGCFSLDFAKMPSSIQTLMAEVARVKALGDKARAERLIKAFVGAPGEKRPLHTVIAERVTRAPKASFVYAITLDGIPAR